LSFRMGRTGDCFTPARFAPPEMVTLLAAPPRDAIPFRNWLGAFAFNCFGTTGSSIAFAGKSAPLVDLESHAALLQRLFPPLPTQSWRPMCIILFVPVLSERGACGLHGVGAVLVRRASASF
jgi:hypothetical protein